MPRIDCRRCGKSIDYEKISDVPTFPFCNRRCKLIDLGNWLDERYQIKGEPLPEGLVNEDGCQGG